MLRAAALLALLLAADGLRAQAEAAAPDTSAAADTLRPPPRALTPDSLPRTGGERAEAALRAALARPRVRTPYPALDARLAGVVWDLPATRAEAVRDLVAMHAAGVRAVRTEIVEDVAVLDAASRLGIALWQDLPVVSESVRGLRARLPLADRLLEAALRRGTPYPAARHFGLARGSDTSERASRAYFERLTARARAAGAQTYFVTRFPGSDRAAGAVDVVLLDARDADPRVLLARWRARQPTPAGLAFVAPGVRPGRPGGWQTPGTEAAQARALENALADLLTLADPPAATFVARWRDAPPHARRRDQRATVDGLEGGLHDAEGTPRPAAQVAEGVFTGRQRVFAVDAGAAETVTARAALVRGGSTLLLAGWLLVLGLGVLGLAAPKLGTLGPRYFSRHDLYREAVERGYSLSAAQTAALGAGLAAAAGLFGASVLRALARTDALVVLSARWAPEAQAGLADGLGQPVVLAGLVALAASAWLLANLVWLRVLVGRRRMRPAQGLSLVVWSRWSWLPLMAGALVLGSVGDAAATALAPSLLVLALVAEAVACFRQHLDLAAVTRVPPARAMLVGLGLPLVAALGALAWLAVQAGPELAFVWHLATRG